jgi:hypothetical protein
LVKTTTAKNHASGSNGVVFRNDDEGSKENRLGTDNNHSPSRSTSPAAVADASGDDDTLSLTWQENHPGDCDEEESNDDNDNAGWERKKDNDGRFVEQPGLGPPAVTDESRDDNASLLSLQNIHPVITTRKKAMMTMTMPDGNERKTMIDVEQPRLGPPSSAWINDECGNHPEETTPLVMEALASFGTTTCGMLSERTET